MPSWFLGHGCFFLSSCFLVLLFDVSSKNFLRSMKFFKRIAARQRLEEHEESFAAAKMRSVLAIFRSSHHAKTNNYSCELIYSLCVVKKRGHFQTQYSSHKINLWFSTIFGCQLSSNYFWMKAICFEFFYPSKTSNAERSPKLEMGKALDTVFLLQFSCALWSIYRINCKIHQHTRFMYLVRKSSGKLFLRCFSSVLVNEAIVAMLLF